MTNPNDELLNAEDDLVLRVRPRPTETVSLSLPSDALATATRVAQSRDMSVPALLKLYIGQGLRQDAAQLYAERVLALTAEVLGRHLTSPEEVAAIMREIQGKAA